MPYILTYLGVDKRQIIGSEEFYYLTDYSDFVSLISTNYSEAKRVFVYIIERKISNPTYYTPSIEMLEKHAEKQQIGTITIYLIDV
jgi:predicted deacetylase